MRTQQLAILLAFLSLHFVAATDVDSNDVPSECQAVCAPVVSLTRSCDIQDGHDDDDDDDDNDNDHDNGSQELNCICSGANASTIIPLCEACVAQYDRNDGHDNDVNDIVRSCSFTTASYNPTAATSALSAASTASGGSLTATTTSTSATRTGTGSSVNTGSSAAQSTGAASSVIIPQVGVLGSAMIAFAALLGL